MQLAGPGVWGLPRDLEAAVSVLREAVAAGVNHIDTTDFYGPSVTNQLIEQVLHPYPAGLVIVTKVGYRRGSAKSWLPALSRQELIQGVHDNLRNLGLDTLDVANLRVGGITGPTESSIEEPMSVLAELKSRGLIRPGSEQCHSETAARGTKNNEYRLRPEFLQRRQSQR
jgi:pyridoxine 4-dehydrogenase